MNINFTFVALLAVSAVLIAQVPQDPGSKAIPLSKVERKNKAPVSSEILRVKLPKPVEMMGSRCWCWRTIVCLWSPRGSPF
jgi:hypothetical protein